MKKVKKNDFSWDEGPVISLYTKDLLETWVIPSGLYLSGFTTSVIFSIRGNIPELDYAVTILPDIPDLNDKIFMYILPNPKTTGSDNHFDFFYIKRNNGSWSLGDTGQQHLLYPYGQVYKLMASNEQWVNGKPMPSNMVNILDFSISENNLLTYQVAWGGLWVYTYYDLDLASYQERSGVIGPEQISGESPINSTLSLTFDIQQSE